MPLIARCDCSESVQLHGFRGPCAVVRKRRVSPRHWSSSLVHRAVIGCMYRDELLLYDGKSGHLARNCKLVATTHRSPAYWFTRNRSVDNCCMPLEYLWLTVHYSTPQFSPATERWWRWRRDVFIDKSHQYWFDCCAWYIYLLLYKPPF